MTQLVGGATPPIVKVRDVLWLLRCNGWQIVRQHGSHRQLRHRTKPGLVTVAGTPHHDLHPKTASSRLSTLVREGGDHVSTRLHVAA